MFETTKEKSLNTKEAYVSHRSSDAATRRGALSEDRKLLSSLSTVTAFSNIG